MDTGLPFILYSSFDQKSYVLSIPDVRVCETNLSSRARGVGGTDLIYMWCTIKYHGNRVPIVNWTTTGGNVISAADETSQWSKTVSHPKHTVQTNHLHLLPKDSTSDINYVCTVYVGGVNGSFSYNWTSPILKLGTFGKSL